jgi:quinol monooxygenase YgiN
MAVYKVAHYRIRPDARDSAERILHDLASYVRKELPDVMWTTYRDRANPTKLISIARAETPAAEERYTAAPGTQAFAAALGALVDGEIEISEYEMVTSSDLAPRHKPATRRR